MTADQIRRPHYTAEVEEAMRAQGLTPPAPEPEPVPEGQVQYYVAVNGVAHNQGTSSPGTVAALLRSIADQLDPATIREEHP